MNQIYEQIFERSYDISMIQRLRVNEYDKQQEKLLYSIKKQEKIRILRENELLDTLGHIRQFQYSEKTDFYSYSYRIMQKIDENFQVNGKMSSDPKVEDINEFQKMEDKIEELEYYYKSNSILNISYLLVGLRQVIQISRQQLKDKQNEYIQQRDWFLQNSQDLQKIQFMNNNKILQDNQIKNFSNKVNQYSSFRNGAIDLLKLQSQDYSQNLSQLKSCILNKNSGQNFSGVQLISKSIANSPREQQQKQLKNFNMTQDFSGNKSQVQNKQNYLANFLNTQGDKYMSIKDMINEQSNYEGLSANQGDNTNQILDFGNKTSINNKQNLLQQVLKNQKKFQQNNFSGDNTISNSFSGYINRQKTHSFKIKSGGRSPQLDDQNQQQNQNQNNNNQLFNQQQSINVQEQQKPQLRSLIKQFHKFMNDDNKSLQKQFQNMEQQHEKNGNLKKKQTKIFGNFAKIDEKYREIKGSIMELGLKKGGKENYFKLANEAISGDVFYEQISKNEMSMYLGQCLAFKKLMEFYEG
ncbi:hypothetical protein PPERSA_03616 [Pseudocohnilembus persalinus]|uniref:Uncharacterized protein n=1 Tax=Pseudocohnilembus persalinus TaxID=266149 RepID=A0A0V0QE19_PSEPJ|nr:hypothetical protein PPERSA_03616 [Pseudocohnilembus persalinus]|eukprot:KRX00395.1 hypothetical protein PPERSA_03616 [Pseudocohnilembus persalinus]